MTRFLSILLLALPLAVMAGCDPTNPDDDDTSGDDDTDVTEVSLTLEVNVTAPIVVDECTLDRDIEVVTESSDGCSGSVTLDEFANLDVDIDLEREHALFNDFELGLVWDEDGVVVELNDEPFTPQIDEDSNGNLTVRVDLSWTTFGSWCYAPEGTYEDEESGYDFDTQTYMSGDQCIMEDACFGQDVVVDADSYSHTTDGGAMCEGTISDDTSTIEAFQQNVDGDQFNYLFIRQ